MRMSKLLLKTLRELPAEAELPSHQLLLRAGLAMPLAAGLYCFTPVGWRVIRRIENIIREEMDRSGAQELHLPALQPIQLFVGPEGGFTQEEVTEAAAAGAQTVSLGPLILRAETAALAALAIIHGDMPTEPRAAS